MKHLIYSFLFTACLAAPSLSWSDESSDRILIEKYSQKTSAELKQISVQKKDREQTLIWIFIAAEDNSPSSYTIKAHSRMDSVYNASPSTLNATLLGTMEAIMARDCGDDIQATKHIGKALKLFDKAVQDAPGDPIIRTYRLSSLIEVPEIFRVNERIHTDLKMLLVNQPGPGTQLLASRVAMRDGNLDKAVQHAQQVIRTTPESSPHHIKAQKILEVIYE